MTIVLNKAVNYMVDCKVDLDMAELADMALMSQAVCLAIVDCFDLEKLVDPTRLYPADMVAAVH